MRIQTWRNSCTAEIFFFILSSRLSWCVYLYFSQAPIKVCNTKTIIHSSTSLLLKQPESFFTLRILIQSNLLKNHYFSHEYSSSSRSWISTSICDKKTPSFEKPVSIPAFMEVVVPTSLSQSWLTEFVELLIARSNDQGRSCDKQRNNFLKIISKVFSYTYYEIHLNWCIIQKL